MPCDTECGTRWELARFAANPGARLQKILPAAARGLGWARTHLGGPRWRLRHRGGRSEWPSRGLRDAVQAERMDRRDGRRAEHRSELRVARPLLAQQRWQAERALAFFLQAWGFAPQRSEEAGDGGGLQCTRRR